MEMMENLSGLPHSHTPPHTPFFPPTFSRSERKILFFIFGPEALRGAYIINTFFPIFIRYYSLSECRLQAPSDRLFSQTHIVPRMISLVLFFLPVSLTLRQQFPRLIDEVEELLRQVTLQHIQHPVNALQQPA